VSLPWFKFNPRDFLEGSVGLTAEERGVYITVLSLIYARGDAIPDEPRWLAGHCMLSVRAWNKHRAALIVKGKLFATDDGRLLNERAATELGIIGAKTEDNSGETPAKTEDKPVEKRPTLNENSDLPGTDKDRELEVDKGIGAKAPRPAPQGKRPKVAKAKAPKSYPPLFEEAWKLYPHAAGRSSKPDTLARWRDLTAEARQALPGCCKRYAAEGKEPKDDCGAPAMERWLKRALHEHWLPKADAPSFTWTGPPQIRTAVVVEQSDAFARSYLDTSEWTGEAIQTRNGYAYDKLRTLRNLRDVKILEPKERAA